jgi:hypothetical protein
MTKTGNVSKRPSLPVRALAKLQSTTAGRTAITAVTGGAVFVAAVFSANAIDNFDNTQPQLPSGNNPNPTW